VIHAVQLVVELCSVGGEAAGAAERAWRVGGVPGPGTGRGVPAAGPGDRADPRPHGFGGRGSPPLKATPGLLELGKHIWIT